MTPGARAVIISTPYPINFWPFFFFFSSFLEWRMEGTRRIETKDIYTHKRATSYRSIGLWNTAIPVGLRAVRPLLSVKVQSNKNSWNLHINQWWREESHSTPSWILNALARSAQCYAVHYCIAPIIIKKWSVTNVVITAPYNGAIIRWCWEAGWMVGGLTLVVVGKKAGRGSIIRWKMDLYLVVICLLLTRTFPTILISIIISVVVVIIERDVYSSLSLSLNAMKRRSINHFENRFAEKKISAGAKVSHRRFIRSPS